MNVAFAGGGTGGHLYPAIALADALRHRASIRFVGTPERLETQIVPDAGYQLVTISSRPLDRKPSLRMLETAGVNMLGIVQALGMLSDFRPDIVVATGGYVCFPVMIAAKLRRLLRRSNAPLALLEPNVQPGLTNRLLAPVVDEVWGAFPEAPPAFSEKYVYTGVPVRASLLRRIARPEAAARLSLDPNRRTILVMGGSQGARSINEAAAGLATRRALPPDWQILHVSGERDYGYIRAEERVPLAENRIVVVPYLRDLADAYAVSDVVVARAGASTLGELAALGMPALLIPYPHASEDHQRGNAQRFEAAGAASVIEDRDLNPDVLWWALRSAMEPQRLAAMRSAARSLACPDPVAAILARIDALLSRSNHRK